MRQKLKFAQAIVHDPPFLILDEPTAGLDPEERVAMLSRIKVLAQKAGKTTVISTHILPDVQAICSQVAILARGQVVVSERLDVLNQPTSPGLTVRILGDAVQLADRLRRQVAQVTLDDSGTLIVQDDSPHLSERIWALARELDVGIRTLVPAQNSLEEIFMQAVRGDRRANS